MSDQNAKRDSGKVEITLVPMDMVETAAVVRMFGNAKYPQGGADNWKQVNVERYRNALFRHLFQYLREPYGIDQESGLPHWYHVTCNVAFITQKEIEAGTIPRPEEALKKMHHPEPLQASASPGTGADGYIYEDEIKTPGKGVERVCNTCRYLWLPRISPCNDCYSNNKWEKKDE